MTSLHYKSKEQDGADGLLAFQPKKGRLEVNVPLARYSWMRVGGKADYFFRPYDEDELIAFLNIIPDDVKIMVMGAASNLLIGDGGVRACVIRLGKGFAKIALEDENLYGKNVIVAGAGLMDIQSARFAYDHGLSGLEFLSGIPGSLGGAVFMNAGAYGREIKDILLAIQVIHQNGTKEILFKDQLGFAYRKSQLPKGAIITKLWLQGEKGDRQMIKNTMDEIAKQREQSQPIRSRTGGSTFKNPDGHKAWQLIDQAGLRGAKKGGAEISQQHCNFLINHGDATAEDLIELGELARAKVKERTGILLEWEIKRIGEGRG